MDKYDSKSNVIKRSDRMHIQIEDAEMIEIIHKNYKKTRRLNKVKEIEKYNKRNIKITIILFIIDVLLFMVSRL